MHAHAQAASTLERPWEKHRYFVNWRNAMFNGLPLAADCLSDKLRNFSIPDVGTLKFDYVSYQVRVCVRHRRMCPAWMHACDVDACVGHGCVCGAWMRACGAWMHACGAWMRACGAWSSLGHFVRCRASSAPSSPVAESHVALHASSQHETSYPALPSSLHEKCMTPAARALSGRSGCVDTPFLGRVWYMTHG